MKSQSYGDVRHNYQYLEKISNCKKERNEDIKFIFTVNKILLGDNFV